MRPLKSWAKGVVMGQAAVDLPDPLESAAAPAAPEGADDLLAQLAGDEIDRLLAEAELEQNAKGAPRTGGADPAFDAALNAPAQTPTHNANAAAQATTLPVVSTPPAPAAPTLSEQMQKVFAGVTPTA